MGVDAFMDILEIAVYAVCLGIAYGKILSRIKVLEQKMDKHNNFIERLIVQEQKLLELRRIVEENSYKKHEWNKEKKYEN